MSDSLEDLIERNENFFQEPISKEKTDTFVGSNTMLRARGNASLLDFLDMVSLIINNTMDDLHVECMPDERAYVLKEDPIEVINHPIVTFKVNERQHKQGAGYKPTLMEVITSEEDGKSAFIYSERYTSYVQFNIMAPEYRIAWTVMDRIEDALLSYAETIKGNGILEYYFSKQYADKYYDTFRNTLTVLNLEYCVETEKLRVIFKENIKDIVTHEEDIDEEMQN